MDKLNKMEIGTRKNILGTLLAVVGWVGIWPTAQAFCFGYPESRGCTVNGVADQRCVGTLSAGNIIEGQGNFDPTSGIPIGCTNTAGPLAGQPTCVIRGLGGVDVIIAGPSYSANNIICGGGGNDIIQGSGGNDVLLGEAGSDVLIGAFGNNLLYGGQGKDTLLTGGAGANFSFGGPGRDVCQSGGIFGFNDDTTCEVVLP